MRYCYFILHTAILFPLLVISRAGQSAELTPIQQQTLHQQERQRALEERLAPPTPDVRLSAPSASSDRLIFPVEKPCFVIDRVTLSGTEPLPVGCRYSVLLIRHWGSVWAGRGLTN